MPNHPDLTGAQLHEPGDHAAQHAPGEPDGLESDYAEVGHTHAPAAPAAHAASHNGGADPVTPAGIGAALSGHNHTGTYVPLTPNYIDLAESGLSGTPGGGFTRFGADANGDLSYTNDAGVTVLVRSPVYIREGAARWVTGFGNGDKNQIAYSGGAGLTSMSPDNVCTASFNRARMVQVCYPFTMAPTDIQILGGSSGSSGSMYKLAIYPVAGGAHIYASAAFDTTANVWGGPSGITGVLMSAYTPYWVCILTTASSAASTIRGWPNLSSAAVFAASGPFDTSDDGSPHFSEYTAAVAGTFDGTLPVGVVPISTATGVSPLTMIKGTIT